MVMAQGLSSLLKRFSEDKAGLAGIEFAFLAPVLIALMLGSISLALMFRDSKSAERAASVVGDVISRQTTVDASYLQTCYKLFTNMTGRGASAVGFRVSSLKKANGLLSVDWSYAVAPGIGLTDAELAKKTLPLVSDNDSLILVETTVAPSPLTTYLGLQFGGMANSIAERPRFTAAVVKTD